MASESEPGEGIATDGPSPSHTFGMGPSLSRGAGEGLFLREAYRALDNGVTKQEISEIITHLAFYAGWPAAMTAALVAKDVFAKV